MTRYLRKRWSVRVRLAALLAGAATAVGVGIVALPVVAQPLRAEAPLPARPTDLRRAYGIIDAVDPRVGRLTLRQQRRAATGPLMEFVVTPRDTAVTDAWDQQFLTPDDLSPGSWVQVEYVPLPTGERKATTIVLERAAGAPAPPRLQDVVWTTGIIQSVDIPKGILMVEEVRPGMAPQPVEFLVTWRDTHVALGRYEQFLALEDLRPGDRVEVGYLLDQGQRKARAVIVELSEPVRRP